MARKVNETEKKKKTAAYVQAAQSLIAEEGFAGISVRKIAQKAGFHNSTIYFYFPDLEFLLSLAAVHQFEEYSYALSEISRKQLTDLELFYQIWDRFCKSTFSSPDLFYHFFFGKHGDKLDQILNTYYDLFPDERSRYSEAIEDMYFGRSLTERCLKLLAPLTGNTESRVTEENAPVINEISILAFQSLLLRQCEEKHSDIEVLSDSYLLLLHHLVDKG